MSKTEKHIEHYPNGQKKEEGYYLAEKKMDYGLIGMRMDGKGQKQFTRMGKKMVNGLIGMRMARKFQKEFPRMIVLKYSWYEDGTIENIEEY